LSVLLRESEERTLHAVPFMVPLLLALALTLQIIVHAQQATPQARAEALEPAPSANVLRAASFGESIVAAQFSVLYLQAFDNQPGISIPFRALDYNRVMSWLQIALQFDPQSGYPLMMASQLYGQVNDEPRQRMMCEFVHTRFLDAPDQRWRWLAHCAIMAKHRLGRTGRTT
jgi:hypothetical protein